MYIHLALKIVLFSALILGTTVWVLSFPLKLPHPLLKSETSCPLEWVCWDVGLVVVEVGWS